MVDYFDAAHITPSGNTITVAGQNVNKANDNDAKNKPWIMVRIALQIIMIFFIYDFVLAPFFGHYFS